jgi:hypothetical protein
MERATLSYGHPAGRPLPLTKLPERMAMVQRVISGLDSVVAKEE